MKFTPVRAALAFLFFASFPLAATWAKPAGSHEADSAAIKKLFSDFNDAFNGHDAHAATMLFADDGDLIDGRGAKSHARTGIEQHLLPLFAGRLKTAHRDIWLQDIRFLRPDMATVDGYFEMSGLVGTDGAAVPPAKGLYDWIVVKQGGRWLIAIWHESNLQAFPTPPSK